MIDVEGLANTLEGMALDRHARIIRKFGDMNLPGYPSGPWTTNAAALKNCINWSQHPVRDSEMTWADVAEYISGNPVDGVIVEKYLKESSRCLEIREAVKHYDIDDIYSWLEGIQGSRGNLRAIEDVLAADMLPAELKPGSLAFDRMEDALGEALSVFSNVSFKEDGINWLWLPSVFKGEKKLPPKADIGIDPGSPAGDSSVVFCPVVTGQLGKGLNRFDKCATCSVWKECKDEWENKRRGPAGPSTLIDRNTFEIAEMSKPSGLTLALDMLEKLVK